MQISANSVRRARWSTRLGFFKDPRPFPIGLRSILPDGGLVSHLRVLVARIYPLVYMEKNGDGQTVFRSERYYWRASESAACDYERMMEKIVDDVEREAEERQRKRRRIGGTANSHHHLTEEQTQLEIQTETRKRLEQMLANRKQVP